MKAQPLQSLQPRPWVHVHVPPWPNAYVHKPHRQPYLVDMHIAMAGPPTSPTPTRKK